MGIPLAALAVQQQPSPLKQYGEVLGIQGAQQEQQLGQQQIQGATLQNQMQQQQLQDSKLFMQSLQKNGGDWDKALDDAGRNGMSGEGYMQYGQQLLAHKQAVMKLQTDQLTNQQKVYDNLDGELQGFKALSPQEQATQWPAVRQRVAQIAPQLANNLPQNPPTPDQLNAFDGMLLGGKTSAENELKRREVAAKESEANTAAQKNARETAEFNAKLPGGPLADTGRAEMADWLSKNPGKGPSDYEIAMKKVVPAFNFNLQNSGASADAGGNPSEIAKAIANGQMAWKDAVSMRTPMATKNAILSQVFKINPNFDTSEFGLEADAAKKARSGAWADSRIAYNTGIDHSVLLLQAAKALDNGDVNTLNSIKNKFKTEFGWPGDITYKAIANAYNHEVTSVISKGHITNQEVGTGNETLPDNANLATIKSVVGAYQSLMTSKRNELDKVIKAGAGNKANATLNVGSDSGGYTPPAGAQTATGPNGHKINVDGGRWVDSKTGKPI